MAAEMTVCGSSSYCSAVADAAVDAETEEASAKPDWSVHTKKSGVTALFCIHLFIFREGAHGFCFSTVRPSLLFSRFLTSFS